MANTIKLKRGSGSDPGSSDLSVGELAVRTDTAKLFTKNDGGSVVEVSGGVDDGDKGDITVSSSGATWTIDNDAVTYAKIQNVSATNRILGRDSSGAGVIEEISPSSLRTMINVADGATNIGGASGVDFNDDVKIRLGDSQDLEILHTGSYSAIRDVGTGNINIESNGAQIALWNSADSEYLIKSVCGGAVEAYYDGVKKAETYTSGWKVTGHVDISENLYIYDDKKAYFGNGPDLQLYHDGSYSFVESTNGALIIRGAGGSDFIHLEPKTDENGILIKPDGAVELYYNNVKKFETTANGPAVSSGGADDSKLYFLTSGHTTTRIGYVGHSQFGMDVNGGVHIRDAGNSYETMFKTISNGAVEIYYDGTKKLETDAHGVKVSNGRFYSAGTFAYIESSDTSNTTLTLKKTAGGADSVDYLQLRDSSNNLKLAISGSGDIDIEDDAKLNIGTGDDLQIYHNGLNSYVVNSTGWLVLGNGGSGTVIKGAANENAVSCTANGAVELYYDNALKFYTQSYGAVVNGDKLFFADNTKIEMGAASDLQIYHDGADSRIHNSTGELIFRTGTNYTFYNSDASEKHAQFKNNSSVDLYENNVLKLRTGTDGDYGSVECKAGKGSDWDGYSIGGYYAFLANNRGNADTCLIYNDLDNETMFLGTRGGATKLYYDGTEKFATNSAGAKVTGQLETDELYLRDSDAILLGEGSDFRLKHDGSNSYLYVTSAGSGNLYIDANGTKNISLRAGDSASSVHNSVVCNSNAGVDLYYNDAKKFETHQYGVDISGNVYIGDSGEGKLLIGDGEDLQLYHSGSHSYIKNNTGWLAILSDNIAFKDKDDGEKFIECYHDGAVEVHYDGIKKIGTLSWGAQIEGGLKLNTDSEKLYIGAGNDLQILHDGTDSWITNATGALYLKSTYFVDIRGGGNETMMKGAVDSSVELYYDNSKKFDTKSTGVKCHGLLEAERDSTVAKFYVSTSGNVDGIEMRHNRGGLSGYTGKMISFRGNDNTEEGNIKIAVTSTQYNTSSDYRLKQNTVTLANGITRLKQLKPYNFEFKKDPGVVVDGFFAHEVQETVPQAASGTKDAVKGDGSIDPQSIDHSKLVPLLTAALQEAISKIETLETKVAALESS